MNLIPEDIRTAWQTDGGTVYLNHGSFGPSPLVVLEARAEWSRRLERQPMDFFLRQMEPLLDDAAETMARFVGTSGRQVVFVDNSTTAMNIVAASTALEPGDEVLLTDHEYGAVARLWNEVCRRAGARTTTAAISVPVTSAEAVVDEILSAVTPRTRLLVVSHVTSPTAIVLPIENICRRVRERGLAVCVDGAHGLAMRDVAVKRWDCDYWLTSCHKWLCGPFGTGLLYVHPRQQGSIRPAIRSWGASLTGRPPHWKDEFVWTGTRDPAGFLSVPVALGFLQEFGIERFRSQTHALARTARQRVGEITGIEPLVPDSPDWYGSMIALPLATPPGEGPPNRADPLQVRLRDEFGISIPVTRWRGRRFLRVSCHLYNTADDLDRLCTALAEISAAGPL